MVPLAFSGLIGFHNKVLMEKKKVKDKWKTLKCSQSTRSKKHFYIIDVR